MRIFARVSVVSTHAPIVINHSGVEPVFNTIVHGRMWMRGPHALQSRVPSAFVAQPHHHACTTTAPRTSVSMHTHPYHTRLFIYALARPMHRATPECIGLVHGGMWSRSLTSFSRESHPRSYHSHIITRAPQQPPNQCQHAHPPISHTPLSPRSRTPYAHSNAGVHADRAWEDVDEGPHGLQSRVPSTFVTQPHHHACTKTGPRTSVSMHNIAHPTISHTPL
jgi:hypothetical protein